MELKDRCKEIILGSLLGDGSLKIQKSYKNARFSFRHSVRQRDYFFWKVKELKEISSENCFWEQNDRKFRYQSLVAESLTELYYLTHQNGKISISRKWLNQLTPLSLTVWWLDDGSLVSDSRQGVFCTDGFDRKGILALKDYLKERWMVKTQIGKASQYYRLWIYSSEELKKFLRIILPYIPVVNTLPKVILLYKDPNLQQRWTSEICQFTKFPRQIIEKYLTEKKKKWRMFRR